MHRFTFLLFLLACCHRGTADRITDLHTSQGQAWGTSWFLVVDTTGEKLLQAEKTVRNRIDQFTSIFSTYEPDSEIQRLNRLPAGAASTVSQPMRDALLFSRELCEKSHGAFWPFFGDVMIQEGFEPDLLQSVKHPATRTQVKPADCSFIDIDGYTFRRRLAAGLNLNALAEGLLLDAVKNDLMDAGIEHFLFEFGGELIAASGPDLRKKGPQKWKAAIMLLTPENQNQQSRMTQTEPEKSTQKGDLYLFSFENAALSSSGTYHNRIRGRSHLIDRSGHGIPELRASSVLCTGERSGILADGLATTVSLVTPAEAEHILRGYTQCAFYYQAESKDGILTLHSPDWPQRE
jgi:thiamine biosynthesis lipoprotein ApbE